MKETRVESTRIDTDEVINELFKDTDFKVNDSLESKYKRFPSCADPGDASGMRRSRGCKQHALIQRMQVESALICKKIFEIGREIF
jgi:hypothetical protein